MNKSHFILPLLCLTSYCASAQTVQWDSTARPAKYHLQVGLFKSYPNASDDIVFLGNSITAGANWNELLGIPQARNRGISGDISFGVLERLDEVTEGKPAKIFILIGINDLGQNTPVEVVLNNYKRMIDRIKKASPATKIYFQTLLPINNTFPKLKKNYNKLNEIIKVNQELKIIAATEKITLIDLHPHFVDNDGRLKKEITEDGLHLNAKGYQIWKKILLPYLK